MQTSHFNYFNYSFHLLDVISFMLSLQNMHLF